MTTPSTDRPSTAFRTNAVFAVALAELRSARRLAGVWAAGAVAVAAGFLMYIYYALLHVTSGAAATMGWTSPRLLAPALAESVLWMFVLCCVFLSFDVRSRDLRDRIADVLDARPISNAELLGGRLAALVAAGWLPVLTLAILAQGFGSLAPAVGWWFGERLEPLSLAAFVFVDALPALVFHGALIVLLAVLLPGRWPVVLVALTLIGLGLWATWNMPVYLLPALSPFAGFGGAASDVAPTFADGRALIQRGALLLLAGGFIVLAAAVHPRPDAASPARRLLIGSGLLGLGVLVLVGLTLSATSAVKQRAALLAAHRDAAATAPRIDLEKITGFVRIEPGERLTLDVELRLAGFAGQRSLLLSFNPGMAVESLLVDGVEVGFRHESGLLAIDVPDVAAGPFAVALRAAGMPTPDFAYLDSVIEPAILPASESSLAALGSESGLFETDYVALMPALRWLPTPGVNLDGRAADFFQVDLQVAVPAGYRVAGPGRPHPVDESETRFRFRPEAPVPEVALFAARFDRRETAIEGVQVELLLHPAHLRNVGFFGDAADAVVTRAAEIFADAARWGLPYPYDGLSIVEVPARLRTWGGGWYMGSVQALPGIVLLRESSFPTARFESWFDANDMLQEEGVDVAEVKLEALTAFFRGDFDGGNLLFGAARNLVGFQTRAAGDGAPALDFVVQQLVARLLIESGDGVFSAHTFTLAGGMSAMLGGALTSAMAGGGASASSVLGVGPATAAVWNRALGASLAELDPQRDPEQAVRVLFFKGRAISSAIIDGLGREKTAALLAELRRRHTGETYTTQDLNAAAATLDADLDALLGDWLHDAALPGFLASPVQMARLPDDARGRPRYQTRVQVHNGEPVPGLLRLRYAIDRGHDDIHWDATEPVRVGGGASVALGIVTDEPVGHLWLAPYLSLNRGDVALRLPEVDTAAIIPDEPFSGSRPSDWRPTRSDAILVDDLDPGFSIAVDAELDDSRIGGGAAALGAHTVIDEGLPVFDSAAPRPGMWTRQAVAGGWGRYRHTVARAVPAQGRRQAVFSAELPTAGRWRLGYHLPALGGRRGPGSNPPTLQIALDSGARPAPTHGRYDMRLVAGGETRVVEFDAADAAPGWHDLGEFQLNAGEVRLVVSTRTDGTVVVADAIRWRPAR